jgi:putative membrane protein insertion efficiency factor
MMFPANVLFSDSLRRLLLLAVCCGLTSLEHAAAACQSCIFSAAAHHHHHRRSSAALWGQVSTSTLFQQSTRVADWRRFTIHHLSQKPALAVAAIGLSCFAPMAIAHRRSRTSIPWLPTSGSNEQTGDDVIANDGSGETEPDSKAQEDPVSTGMVAALGFYKNFISPILPPACRFVPTCSQYGVQAIKEFGPGKGSILIAWRLLRCSPVGGKGYDPPRWPPVSFTYGSW